MPSKVKKKDHAEMQNNEVRLKSLIYAIPECVKDFIIILDVYK